jgi:tRNA nucleotidyltransferase/poly(A) polymerase
MPDYMFLLESRLSPEQRAVLERVQELSLSQGINIYLTGGAVRDLISGQPIRDLDFTVEGNPVRLVRELEKGGARIVWESERLRQYEMIFAGDVDGSISAARDDFYDRPGAKPEYRFSSIMEDLRRRDFSINAIAISLNTQSRGLLLDPMNGLADLERQEVRALSIHSFTNQPIRILRILRYCARMNFKMESRTQEWFDLAFERRLQENLDGAGVGEEVRAVSREDIPIATLRQWETRGLLTAIHPRLQRRKPDYDSLNKLARVRSNLLSAGLRPRLQVIVAYYVLGRLKSREVAAALRHLEFRSQEVEALTHLPAEGQRIARTLKSGKLNAPREAYSYIASLPTEMLVFVEVEFPYPRALSRIRSYVQKWRPMHLALPGAELDSLGVPRGPKFEGILERFFDAQLRGRGRNPEDRTRILRQLAGIKEPPKKKPEKAKKKRKGSESVAGPAQHGKPGEGATGTGGALAATPESKSRASRSAAIAARAGARPKREAVDDSAKKHVSGGHNNAPARPAKKKSRG